MIPKASKPFKGARFASFMKLTESNIARAVVAERIWHYSKNPRIKIGGKGYSTLSNSRFEWELGLARRTIIDAFGKLEKDGVIEVLFQNVKGRRRRCVRMLVDPLQIDIGPEPGVPAASEPPVHPPHLATGCSVTPAHAAGAASALDGCAGLHLPWKKKKEKTENDTSAGGPTAKMAQPISGEASPTSTPQSPPPPEAPVVPYFEHATSDQQSHAYQVAQKLLRRHNGELARGEKWTGAKVDWFWRKFSARQARETIRTTGQNAAKPRPPLSLSFRDY